MPRIPVIEILNDIRAGMPDVVLMRKYRLSFKRLIQVMQRLVKHKAIAHRELYEKSPTYRSVIDVLVSRSSLRWNIPFPIEVYHDETSQKGVIRDISENGLRVAGITAKEGDVMTLRLPLKEVVKAEPIEFQAVCRWSKTRGQRRKYIASGFQIVRISEDSKSRLRELIGLLRRKSGGKGRVQHLLLDLPEKGQFVTNAGAGAAPREYSGKVDGVDILDLVQFLLLIGKKTLLHVRSSQGIECQMYLAEGRVVDAIMGNLKGENAFFACMDLAGGYFRTQPWHDPSETTIHELGELLLIEAARRRDESVVAKSPKAPL